MRATEPTSSANKDSNDDGGVFRRVRVLVRCRPLTAHEHGHRCSRVHVREDDGVVLVCNNDNGDTSNTDTEGNTRYGDARAFRFDRVLGPHADQSAMFAEVAPLVEHVLRGYHATVFAYGQTGSGKTYTMDGLRYTTQPRPPLPSCARTADDHGDGDGNNSSSNNVYATTRTTSTTVVADVANTPVDEHGIVPRVIQLLYDRAREAEAAAAAATHDDNNSHDDDESDKDSRQDVSYTLRCSYYQIYKEQVTDLLRRPAAAARQRNRHGGSDNSNGSGDGGGLRVRWHDGDTFRVQNLFVCECESAARMRAVWLDGVRGKVMGSHDMNAHSSRSHSVFTIYVECHSRGGATDVLVRRSEFALVDLAGSEKLRLLARTTAPSATLLRESIEINTSLLTLGKVIMALSDAAPPSSSSNTRGDVDAKARKRGANAAATLSSSSSLRHVPYRESKLTMLLKHALGGNSLTMMLACISPSDAYVDETVSTLLYAGRARNIANVPRSNEDATAVLVRQLRAEVRALKQELQSMRALASDALTHRIAAATTTSVAAAAAADVAARRQHQRTAADVEHDGDTQRVGELAESLLTACDMLQRLLRVHGELRDAYDAVRGANAHAQQREVQLNAENMALRERIAALESIVLDGGDNNSSSSSSSDSDSDDDEVSDTLPRAAPRDAADEATVAVVTPVATHTTRSTATTMTATRPPVTAKRRHAQQQQQQRHHRRRRGGGGAALARMLAEYEHQYRSPAASATQTYGAYYGAAQQRVARRHDAAAATVAKMQQVLSSLPVQQIQSFVPQSLRTAERFGELAFAGDDDDDDDGGDGGSGGGGGVAAYVEQRRARAARRAALLQRQQELYAAVHRDVLAVSSTNTTPTVMTTTATRGGNNSSSREMGSPYANTLPPPSSVTTMTTTRTLSRGAAAQRRDDARTRHSGDYTAAFAADNNNDSSNDARYALRRPHTAHASHTATATAQSSTATMAAATPATSTRNARDGSNGGDGNSSSMARLLRYLQREQQQQQQPSSWLR